jgi:bifunctional non-homologous end joining protein LigD
VEGGAVTGPEGAAPAALEIAAGGRTLALANPAKVMFPATGFTKRDVADYYLAVAPALLPHLEGRAVTLARYPDGVDAPGWYQVNCPQGRPPWVGVAELRGSIGQVIRYCRLDEAAALAWAASTGALELHPLLAPVGRATPSALVLDLDPHPPAGLADCARIACRVREILAARRLAGYPKASGGRGLHVHVPLDGAAAFAETRAFARAVARLLADREPSLVTDRMPLAGRAGKVLVDWRQNSPGRSLIAPWSLRAARLPLVAAPLRWEEVERAAAAGDAEPLRIGPAEALARLARDGDPFAPVAATGQRLPAP